MRHISIHAPRTGSDHLPGVCEAACGISIHAPRTGSDGGQMAGKIHRANFNPRSPHGERLRLANAGNFLINFNPRSPHGERHIVCGKYSDNSITISIHAPRTGSDVTADSPPGDQHDFNPRSPHGERPFPEILLALRLSFQSTLPARGATADNLPGLQRSDISIHAPRTGSDDDRLLVHQAAGDFNPRSPHGERRITSSRSDGASAISIHAPRTGSDRWKTAKTQRRAISIHAPRTGSDRHV